MEGLQQALIPERELAGILSGEILDRHAKAAGSQEGLKVSEAEFWETWYHDRDYRYEWNNGYLEVKPLSDYKGYLIGRWFTFLLHAFLEAHPIARTVGMDIGFRLAFYNGVSIRKPDYAVILNSNPIDIDLDDASYRGIYDLCLEFLSCSSKVSRERDTVHKKREYAGVGVQEYFILDPRGQDTAFYRLDQGNTYQPIAPVWGDIIQSSVLPGFQFRVRDLYEQPNLKHLIHNPVYQHYVLLDYQKAEHRIEQERQRAEQNECMLTLEKQRAEKLANKLRELGISPEDVT